MPAAQFSRQLFVKASPEVCWQTFTDVAEIVSWVSVVHDVEEREPLAHYTAVLTDRLGPFKLRADLDIKVTGRETGERIEVRASGEDRQVASRISVDATLTLQPLAEGTAVQVDGAYEVAGRVATMGAATIRKKAETILAEFFDHAEAKLN